MVDAAHEDVLLTEQIGLGLFGESGLDGACAQGAQSLGVSQAQRPGLAIRILLDSHDDRDATASGVLTTNDVARALRGNHEHRVILRRLDVAVVDVEAVGKGQGVAVLQIGGDVSLIHIGLDLVVDEHHHDVAPLGGLGNGLDGKPRGLRLGPVLGAFPQAHADLAAGVFQVQGMGMALRAVADHGDLLAVEIVQVAILFIIHLSHGRFLLFIMVLC